MIYSHANLHCVEVTVSNVQMFYHSKYTLISLHTIPCLAHSVTSSNFFLHTSQ